ncbi:MAG: hypothetical protein MSG64_14035 [Pyrinomonadaceae bacterium MAG19_C2-C3]|nr:hypothetical protein [Pyrinomonadaceae bacterium MAG19_C2-C3]
MKKRTTTLHRPSVSDPRHGERGAALVTALLIGGLLLAIGGVLVLTTTMSKTAAADVTAEAQAYYAAEAGMQAALNALRGNIAITTDGTAITTAPNRVSFKGAAIPATSNDGSDASTAAELARMSKWLPYSYKKNAVDERVPLTSPYSPFGGMAYSVKITAPDKPIAGTPPVVPTRGGDDGFNKPSGITVKPTRPDWHGYNCAHCSWDYLHCRFEDDTATAITTDRRLKDDANPAIIGSNPQKYCSHDHCDPGGPGSPGDDGDDGYQRIILHVTGYGPRGARKEMELLVTRTALKYEPLVTIYMQGAQTTTVDGSGKTVVADSGGGMTFNPGSNNSTRITGKDEGGPKGTEYPTIGFTNDVDSTGAYLGVNTDTVKDAEPETLSTDERELLPSADAARSLLADIREVAKAQGRHFQISSPGSGGFGSTSTSSSRLLTFVEGDAVLSGDGAGLLVVTGDLTLSGSVDFKGLILVLGGGRVLRSGSGDCKIQGAIVVAKFDQIGTGNFLASTFDLSGSTSKSEIKMNTEEVTEALSVAGIRVLGVREF